MTVSSTAQAALEQLTLAALGQDAILRWLLCADVQPPPPAVADGGGKLESTEGAGRRAADRAGSLAGGSPALLEPPPLSLGAGWAARLERRQLQRPYWRQWLKRRALRCVPALRPMPPLLSPSCSSFSPVPASPSTAVHAQCLRSIPLRNTFAQYLRTIPPHNTSAQYFCIPPHNTFARR